LGPSPATSCPLLFAKLPRSGAAGVLLVGLFRSGLSPWFPDRLDVWLLVFSLYQRPGVSQPPEREMFPNFAAAVTRFSSWWGSASNGLSVWGFDGKRPAIVGGACRMCLPSASMGHPPTPPFQSSLYLPGPTPTFARRTGRTAPGSAGSRDVPQSSEGIGTTCREWRPSHSWRWVPPPPGPDRCSPGWPRLPRWR